jgi:hypothetical protein
MGIPNQRMHQSLRPHRSTMKGPATQLQGEEYKEMALLEDKGQRHSTIVGISFSHQTKKEITWLT